MTLSGGREYIKANEGQGTREAIEVERVEGKQRKGIRKRTSSKGRKQRVNVRESEGKEESSTPSTPLLVPIPTLNPHNGLIKVLL